MLSGAFRGRARRMCTTMQINVARLGPEDSVVKLDVGGTPFKTLRSTLGLSPVLLQHIQAAERNPALMQEAAIFVDRNPAAFPIILEHLRNQAAGVVRPGKLKRMKIAPSHSVELEGIAWVALREVHVEAGYYQLPLLQQEVNKWLFTVGIWHRFGSMGFSPSAVAKLPQLTVACAGLLAAWFGIKEATKVEDREASSECVAKIVEVAAALSK